MGVAPLDFADTEKTRSVIGIYANSALLIPLEGGCPFQKFSGKGLEAESSLRIIDCPRRACARSRSASVSLSVTARASADNKVILKIDQGSLVPPIKRARVGSKSKAPPEGRGARISALQACDCCAACRTSRPAPVRKRSAQRSGPTATAQWRSPSARIRRAGGASGRAWPLERSSPRGRSPRCG